MSVNANLFESCREMILQDTMFDVAAAIAATEPESAGEPKKPAAAQPAMNLRWSVLEPVGRSR
jgi:hypothetical protein